ncbi:hypothetical protein J0X12_13255 [Sneathiella sp. CAU 1612]|uniref:Uncharacterized protein n=1 Tax=Sneathiella sedimenti TaxID=2816034 RepID=A0ABS3F7T9_9PROT|nr:hypothetical protein [Sneathiella sedimenti]MBO0334590.1 hypothetical protein [Sneathiella sedimenti]
MEITHTVKPTACLLEAFRFVIGHRWPCLFRAVPVVMMTALIAWLETNILAAADYFRLVVNEILYAIFSVYWHRYTVFKFERRNPSFGLHFGLREIKFAGAMLGYVLITYVLAKVYVASGGDGSSASIMLFVTLLCLCFMPLMFIFPAIALDQPLALKDFARTVIDMFLPLVGTFLLALVAVVGLYVLIYMPMLLLILMNKPDMAGILFFVLSSFLIMPFILAVFISFLSILFRETVGIQPINYKSSY